jgi:hypothetical protein
MAGIAIHHILLTCRDPLAVDGYSWPSVRNISFEVDDLDAKLAAMGGDVEVTFGPLSFDDFILGWRSVWLRDPEGEPCPADPGVRGPGQSAAAA